MTELDDYRKFKRSVTTATQTLARISFTTLNPDSFWQLPPYCNKKTRCRNMFKKRRGIGRGTGYWRHTVKFCTLIGTCNHRTFNRKEATVNNGDKKE